MNRTNVNIAVDTGALVLMTALAATGLLMEFVLPPRSGEGIALWGMNRHEWGEIHLWIAYGFLALLAVHLLMHVAWIKAAARGKPSAKSRVRPIAAVAGLGVLTVLVAALYLSPVERVQAGEGRHGREHVEVSHDNHGDGETIRGSMTLGEVERLTGVPSAWIAVEVGMPDDVPPSETLGHLRQQYGFDMARVRDAVAEYHELENGDDE